MLNICDASMEDLVWCVCVYSEWWSVILGRFPAFFFSVVIWIRDRSRVEFRIWNFAGNMTTTFSHDLKILAFCVLVYSIRLRRHFLRSFPSENCLLAGWSVAVKKFVHSQKPNPGWSGDVSILRVNADRSLCWLCVCFNDTSTFVTTFAMSNKSKWRYFHKISKVNVIYFVNEHWIVLRIK